MGDSNKSRSDREVLDLAGNEVERDTDVGVNEVKGKEGLQVKNSADSSSGKSDTVVPRDNTMKPDTKAVVPVDLKKNSNGVPKGVKKNPDTESVIIGRLKNKSEPIVSKDDKKKHSSESVVSVDLEDSKPDSEQSDKERTDEKNVCKDNGPEVKDAVEFLVSKDLRSFVVRDFLKMQENCTEMMLLWA